MYIYIYIYAYIYIYVYMHICTDICVYINIQAGGTVEATFGILVNHGGGYQYRCVRERERVCVCV